MTDRREQADGIAAALTDLAAHLDVPEPRDVGNAVRAHVERRRRSAAATGHRRRHRFTTHSRLALATIAVVVSAAFVVAVPTARHALGDLLGLRGTRVEYRSPAAPVTTAAAGSEYIGLGESVTLEEARRRLPGLLLPVPSALGDPARILAATDRAEVTLVYVDAAGRTRALLTEYRGDAGEFFHKMIGPSTDFEPETVGAGRGVWISGPNHFVFYTDEDGNFVESSGRLSGSALIWEHDEIVLRLEGPFTKDQAMRIATDLTNS
jgi:hypothetical protein